MPTQTKTNVIVQASAKLVSEIKAMINAESSLECQTIVVVRSIQTESARNAYDADQSRAMLFASVREARRGTVNGLNKDAKKDTPESIKDFDNKQRFQVSRLMALAFPKAEVAAEVEKALSHDESKNGAKHGRVGVNRMIEIARGNLTTANALAGVKPTRANAPQTTPEVVDLSLEALENALAGLRSKFVKPEGRTPVECRTLAALVFCDGVYEPSKDKAAKAAAKAAKAAAKK